jgi:hypothetical protein
MDVLGGGRRRLIGVIGAVSLVVGVAGIASGSVTAGDHPRRVQPPGALVAGRARPATASPQAGPASSGPSEPPEFTTTANPTTLDPPVVTPPTRPRVVTIAERAAFANASPPATTTVTLPRGRWAQVVLQVTGTESGRQFDRLLEIFDGPTQIFLGVTPEPTPQGITWHVSKDVTGYLPVLAGRRTFSTFVDNYLSSIDTGVPVITAKLLFYPAGGGFAPTHPASPANPALAGDAVATVGPASPVRHPGVPNAVVPLLPSGSTTTFNLINSGQTETATVTLPHDLTTATLDLYAVGQINEEFWYGLAPGFREIEISIDGKPAGVVWPFPYVYTGGVNPLIWRPITAIHTLDIPAYRVDLSPFAGLLGGTHSISITVVNNTGYWLAGGSLLLTEGRQPTSGRLLADTLQFPTTSQTTTANALGSADQPVTSEAAAIRYRIAGRVVEGHRSWTDQLSSSLQFGDDQSNIDPSCSGDCYQWLHAEETASTQDVIDGVVRSDRSSWTIDAPNGFLPANGGADFFLPASVSQQQSALDTQLGAHGRPGYTTQLSESIIGYGALEEDNSAATITNGETTGTVSWSTSAGQVYNRTVVARGGVIEQDVVSG